MKRYLNWLVFLSLLFPTLLGACTLPVRWTRFLAITISNPAESVVIGLGEIVPITADATSTTRPVTLMMFYANALMIGETSTLFTYPAPVGTGYSGDFDWTPLETGEYFVQAQANRGAGSAISAPIRVCVIDFIIDPGSYDAAYGYEGPCPIPDRSPAAVPGPVTMVTISSPDSLLYDPTWFSTPSCPGLTSITLSFQASVIDPPEDVAFVAVYYSMTGGPASRYPGHIERHTLVLTQTRSLAPSTRVFTGSTENLIAELAGNFVDQPGEVIWTARALGRDGSVLVTDGPHTIPAEPCTPTPLSAPLPGLDLSTITPTPTPASEADCPPGTYFAPATNRCIPIQIITAAPGGGDSGGGNACQPPPGGCGPTEYWSTATCSCKVFE